ncbi:hypothetical protein VQ056_05140 [Paenibacillus sp. JTLBN-2024]
MKTNDETGLFLYPCPAEVGKIYDEQVGLRGIDAADVPADFPDVSVPETPWNAADPEMSITPEIWVYSYAMLISIASDAILAVLPPLSKMKQAALYAAAGYSAFTACSPLIPRLTVTATSGRPRAYARCSFFPGKADVLRPFPAYPAVCAGRSAHLPVLAVS